MYWLFATTVCCLWSRKCYCCLHTLPRPRPWRTPASNRPSAHWSGRRRSALFCPRLILWNITGSLLSAKTCVSVWKSECPLRFQGGSCPQVLDCCWFCLKHFFFFFFLEQHFSACLLECARACAWVTPSLPCLKGGFHCDGKSVVLHVNVSGLHRKLSSFVLFVFLLMTSCLGSGMHRITCPARLALDCCAWVHISLVSVYSCSLNCEWSQWVRARGFCPLPPASKFLRWSQQAKLCCFGFCRTVRVHSHWTCRPSLRHPRASHPTPPQLPHRLPLLLLLLPSWAPQAPWSTVASPPASEDFRPESAQ